MAASQNIQATFATLPRELRDMVYTQMLTNTERINTTDCTRGLDQQEDWKMLRGMLHACRDMPQYAEEAIEVFFRINTFRIEAEYKIGFLSRPAYYVKARGFIPMMMLVKSIETQLTIDTTTKTISTTADKGPNDPLRLRKFFRELLACPVLRRVTVNVGLFPKQTQEDNIPKAAVVNELDIILNAATGSSQRLNQRLELKFSSRNKCYTEHMEAWVERVGKAAMEEI